MMRKPGKYRAPAYRDPNDRRLVEIIQEGDKAAKTAVNIMGIPFDGAVLGRKGAAGGPEGIRGALSGFSNYDVELDMSLAGARVVDIGDIQLGDDEVERAHGEIESEVGAALGDDSMLVLLGGDNSVSLPSLRAYAKEFGPIGLVVVDSHLDLRGKIRGEPTSGSSYGLAVQTISDLDPRRVSEVGIHGFLNSEVYVNKAKKLGIRVITAKEVKETGAKEVAREAYETAAKGAKAVYVSIDLDAVDISAMSGVSAPSAGGIGASDLLEIAYYLASQARVKCVDLVELAPALDPTGRSERVAATTLVYLIAGFVSRSKP